jgi:hypothetical protein
MNSASAARQPNRIILGALAVAALVALAGCTAPVSAPPTPVLAWSVLPSNANIPMEIGSTPSQAGCFAGLIPNEPWGPRIAESTVHIHTPADNGVLSGTGFVVRDSGVDGSPRNRIITAKHVIGDTLVHGGLLEISNASGAVIGYAGVVAEAPSGKTLTDDNRILIRGDEVVLEMEAFEPGGEALFSAIRGIDLAPALPRNQLEGYFDQPAGIVGGASGSPVINSQGQAVAVLISSLVKEKDVDQDTVWSADIKLNAADALWYGREHALPGSFRSVTLPARSISFAESLEYPEITSALGNAGRAAAVASPVDNVMNVRIPGFPEQVCIVYRGNMYTAGRMPN